ncbi:MAG: polysaccharide deacetylase family protein [Candidatus Acidiferrales bacterium]
MQTAVTEKNPMSSGLATAAVIPTDGRPCAITYHEIEPEHSTDIYRISCGELEQHLVMLDGLSKKMPRGFPIPQVTFDDGHISNYRYAPALLEKHGQKAIFFLVASDMGKRPQTMTWEQAREMVSMGHEMQSHTWSHRRLPGCTDSDLDVELRRSRETIEEHLGMRVDAISIPYGRWDRRVLEGCARAGYRRVYTSDPWIVPGMRSGVMVFGRLTIRSTMDGEGLEKKLTLDGTPLRTERAKYHAKQVVKQVLGDKIYHRLWSRFVGRDEPKEMA